MSKAAGPSQLRRQQRAAGTWVRGSVKQMPLLDYIWFGKKRLRHRCPFCGTAAKKGHIHAPSWHMIQISMLYVGAAPRQANADIRHSLIGAMAHGRSPSYFRILCALAGEGLSFMPGQINARIPS